MAAMNDAAKQNPSTEELDELDTIIRVGIKELQEEVERHGDRLDLETVVTITGSILAIAKETRRCLLTILAGDADLAATLANDANLAANHVSHTR
jgi:hypothetical protein